MNAAENRKKWSDALRSGEFNQSMGALKSCIIENSYCCLGVACEVYQREVGDLKIDGRQYDGEVFALPAKVQRWLDIDTCGTLKTATHYQQSDNAETLIALNDKLHFTFEQIADVIDSDKIMSNEEANDFHKKKEEKMRVEESNLIRSLSYSDISLVSRHISEIPSRNSIIPKVDCFGLTLTVPIIASPMPDVCDGQLAAKIYRLGGYGFIHRFMSIDSQCNEYINNIVDDETLYCGCAIGANGDYLERLESLYDNGCRSFCVDVANGASIVVERAMEKLAEFDDCYFTVGNVSTRECLEWVAKLPVAAIRIGQAGGSGCSTKNETGIYYKMASCLMECCEIDTGHILKIADGGITEPSDMCKALALGANIVMLGGTIGVTFDSPAQTIKIDGKLKKIFRGAASFSAQREYKGVEPKYVEGLESIRDIGGSLEGLVERYRNGLVSSMSYMNATTLEEYIQNSTILRI